MPRMLPVLALTVRLGITEPVRHHPAGVRPGGRRTAGRSLSPRAG